MKKISFLLALFFSIPANAQSVGIIDVSGSTNTRRGNTHSPGSLISTYKGELSAYFAWQRINLFVKENTTVSVSKVQLCEKGGRQSFWIVSKGKIIIQKDRFSNSCSKAVFSTNKGVIKLAGTKGQIADSESMTIVGVSDGIMTLENEGGVVTLVAGQYGTVIEGQAPVGPFAIRWNDIRPTVQYRDRAKLNTPLGFETIGMTATAPNGEQRQCRLLPHRQLKCN